MTLDDLPRLADDYQAARAAGGDGVPALRSTLCQIASAGADEVFLATTELRRHVKSEAELLALQALPREAAAHLIDVVYQRVFIPVEIDLEVTQTLARATLEAFWGRLLLVLQGVVDGEGRA